MRRATAVAVVLTVLAPLAGLIALACSAVPCCAGGETRLAATTCCPPTLCADRSAGEEEKNVPLSPALVALERLSRSLEVLPRDRVPRMERPAAHPRATSVRLALIATLLI